MSDTSADVFHGKPFTSISRKLLVPVALALLFTTLGFSIPNYLAFKKEHIEKSGAAALSAASMAAVALDGDAFAKEVVPGERTEYSRLFKTASGRLGDTTASSRIYAVVPDENGDYAYYPYYADAHRDLPANSRKSASLFARELASVFVSGQPAVSGVYDAGDDITTRHGLLVSGLAPVFDSGRKVVGVVGADMPMEKVFRDIQKHGLKLFLVSLLATLAGTAAAAWYFRRALGRRLDAVVAATHGLAAGEPALPPRSDENDEIGLAFRNIAKAAASIAAVTGGTTLLARSGARDGRAKQPHIASDDLPGTYRQVANAVNLALAFMENVNSLVYVVDLETFEFIYCNKRMRTDYVSGRQGGKGLRCWEIMGEEPGKGMCGFCRIPEMNASGEEFPECSHELYVPQTKTWWRTRNSIVSWFDGRKALFVECTDITARKRYEEGLKKNEREHARAAAAAEQASRLKTNFLANMSHEIRTPMNGILGFAELAMGDPAVPSGARDYLRKIHFSADGLLHILDDILDISKIESGIRKVECLPFRLADIVEYCEMINSPRAREKGLTLLVQIDPGLDAPFYGDPARLRQALLNLLSNAVRFTEKGMVKLQCTREGATEKNITLRFEVSDSGIGIAKDRIEHIFDSFSQADSGATRTFGGTGLGLAITKGNIEAMGGELKVVSTQGIGSKFIFILTFGLHPAESADAAAKPPEPATANAPVPETWYFNHPPKPTSGSDTGYWPTPVFTDLVERPVFFGDVLVCEDNELNTEVIVEQLNRVGIKPVVAQNGRAGVDIVKKRLAENKPFDLVLMDIQMPVMGGLDAASRMRAYGLAAPIVALTANVMKSARESYLKAGLAGCLGKPFTTGELWACLRTHLKEGTTHSAATESEKDGATLRSLAALDARVLDSSAGLEHAAGNAKLYLRLLANFRKDNRDTLDKLKKAIDKGDKELSRRIAHTLKGTSGMIGASSLRSAAAALEQSIADGLPHAPALADTERRMFRLLAALSELLPSSGAAAAPGEKRINRAKAAALVEQLKPLLHDADAEALNYLNLVKTTFSPLGAACSRLIEQMENYDFEEAAATLASIEAAVRAGDHGGDNG